MMNPNENTGLVLASAPLSMGARYGKLSGAGNNLAALGLLYLAAAARRGGFPVAVVEAGARAMDEAAAAEAILVHGPAFVGLSATTLGIAAAGSLAQRLKQTHSGLKVVVGGPHATALPEDTLSRYPAFDAAAVGEGELTLVELLTAWRDGANPGQVAGLAIRGPDGKIVRTASRARVEELDSLATPAWDLLEGFPHDFSPPAFRFRKLPAVSLVSSRGCPFECSFCDRSVFGRKVRFHQSDYLLRLIGDLWERGVREILFEDDTFTANKNRVRAFSRVLAERFPKLSWSCLARAALVDPETLALMRDAGCWQISFGIESGDAAVLAKMGKSTNLEEIRRGVELTRASGIQSKGFFILGYPGETRQSLDRTLEFALSLPLDDVSVSMFTPFPGSPIYQEAAKHGSFDEDWTRMSLLNAVFVPHGLTRADIEQAHATMLKRFYLRPKVVWSYARRVSANPRTAGSYWKGLVGFANSVTRS